jgi:uncharacterized protein (DUF983 family)
MSRRLKLVETVPAPTPRPRPSVALGSAYHPGLANRCPLCGHTAFNVGRITAECGACAAALPISPSRNPFPIERT